MRGPMPRFQCPEKTKSREAGASAPLARRADPIFHERDGSLDGGVYSQIAGIEQGGVGSPSQRRGVASRVARVAAADVGEHLLEGPELAARGELGLPAPPP